MEYVLTLCVICERVEAEDFCDTCLEHLRFFDAVPAAREMFIAYGKRVIEEARRG